MAGFQTGTSTVMRVSTGAQIGIRCCGTGPVTLFLHGIGGHKDQWVEVLRRLQGGGTLIAWDARGYGQSGGPPLRDFSDFAADLIGLIDALGLERVLGVGHSMGGRILIETACRAPERFGALLLSGAQPAYLAHLSRQEAKAYAAARQTMFDGDAVRPDMACTIAKQVLAAGATEAQTARLARDFLALNRTGFLAALEASVRWDRREDITGLDLPIDIVGGALDPICPADVTRELASLCGAEPLIFGGVGHMPQIEAPDLFADAIGAFIARNRQSSSSLQSDRSVSFD